MLKILCCVLVLSNLGLQVNAQDLPTDFEKQVDEIFADWNSTHTPGGTIGVVKNGELIFSKAYGMASLEYDIPNTPQTIFNIASVTKQITAYSMVLLEQEGKLSLDDPIQKHLTEIPTFEDEITIRHLLHHTSGLRNFQSILSLAGWRNGESMTNDDLLHFLSMQKELNFKPGAEYLYCNTGFNIITTIVERISGQSFQDWTQEHIFQPLGMNNSSYREDLEAVHKNTATSYEGTPGTKFRQPLKYWTYMGNGNVYTTIEDLSKWQNNFRKPTLGGAAGIQTLVTPGILNNGEQITYGLGIGVGTFRGLKRYSHGGSVGGYRSNMIYFPEQELGVIVLSNFSTANPGGKVSAIRDILLEDEFTEPLPPARVRKPIGKKAVTIDSKLIDSYVGKYYVEGVLVELTKRGEQLLIFAKGELPQPMPVTPSSETDFFMEGVDLVFRITEPAGDNPRRIMIEYGGDRVSGFQLAYKQPGAELLGTYYSPELDTRYEIVQEDGKMLVKHQRHETFELFAVSKNVLKGTAYFFSDVKVERNAQDQVKGIRVSSGRLRNLWFEKR